MPFTERTVSALRAKVSRADPSSLPLHGLLHGHGRGRQALGGPRIADGGQEDPKNYFSAAAGDAYDLSVVTGMPAWREVQLLVSRELGEPVPGARPLVRPGRSSW